MDKLTRDLFKRLLLDLPLWNGQRERKTFIHNALWGHVITRHLEIEGEPDTVASELLSRCVEYDTPTEEGVSPLCAVLAEIRNRDLATGSRREAVADLERRLGCTSSKPAWPYDPYPGLLAFDHWQAPIFFGRTVEIRDLLWRLDTEQGRRLLIVTGSSGAGKSSLVRAGLWAKLKAGTAPNIPGSDQWLMTAMFPTAQGGDPFLALTSSLTQEPRLGGLYPYREAETLRKNSAAFANLLHRVLADLPPTAEWLLILDQMEELFTPAAESYRDMFLDLLLAAVELPRFRVVATVRSDFYVHCEAHPGLREVLNRDGGRYSVGVPGPLAMTRMVAGPVEDVALATPVALDPDLVSAIADEAVAEPGGLALMAFALKDLYDQCKATGRMDLRAYQSEAFGGLKGVIARRADRAFERASEAERAALPRVFSHLVTIQDDGTATRRRADKRVGPATMPPKPSSPSSPSRIPGSLSWVRTTAPPWKSPMRHCCVSGRYCGTGSRIGARRCDCGIGSWLKRKPGRIRASRPFCCGNTSVWLPPGHCSKRRICSNTWNRTSR